MNRLIFLPRWQATHVIVLLAIIMSSLTGCQDECERTYTYTLYEPVYMSFEELRASIQTQPAKEIQEAGKIYIIDKYLLINEPNEGIHVFDNSNPSSPKNVSFINIPGNVDMAVKGNILYADSHTDLVAFDISNPAAIVQVGRVEDIFPVWTRTFATNGQIDPTKGIVIDWKQTQTTQISGCEQNTVMPYMWYDGRYALISSASADKAYAAPPSKPGLGGSMARYTIYDNYLYTIDNSNMMLFDISDPQSPRAMHQINVGWNIETIFPYKDKLFIGSQTGMHIYDNADPGNPVHISTFAHVRSCDPVVADDKYAYVTLRNGTSCGGFTNQLDVVDISNLASPKLVKSYPMGNPHGLGLDYDNQTLFVCDGSFGLKVYNATDPFLLDKNYLGAKAGHAFDVIPYKNLAIVTGNNGIFQYDYTNPRQLKLLSKIEVAKQQ